MMHKDMSAIAEPIMKIIYELSKYFKLLEMALDTVIIIDHDNLNE